MATDSGRSRFFDKPKPHSETKRRLLKGSLQGFFGMNFCDFSVLEQEEYRAHFLDSFCGAGKYGQATEVKQKIDNDVCVWGSPIVAVHVCCDLLERLLARSKVMNDGDFKCCHFHFVDHDFDVLSALEPLVKERFQLWGWNVVPEDSADLNKGDVKTSMHYSKQIEEDCIMRIRVDYYHQDFQVFDASIFEGRRLFTFLDPFDCKGLGQVKHLIGDNKFILIVLMVDSIHRKKRQEEGRRLASEAFGGWAGWKLILDQKGLTENEKFQQLCQAYEVHLRNLQTDAVTVSFAVRKGKKTPEDDTLFHMVFATTRFDMLHNMKFAMMKNTQSKDELAFSDYYSYKEIDMPLGRKTTDEEEAKVIFKHFQGRKEVTLKEIKRFVLQDTIYPYHARVLRLMEREGGIEKVDTHGMERKNKSFDCVITKDLESSGSAWTVDFAD